MVRSGHARPAAWAAAAVLLVVPAVTGCAGEPDPGPGGRGTSGVPSVAAPVTPTGNGPADPAAAKAQIEKNWATFVDPKASTEEKVEVLEQGDRFAPLLAGIEADANASRASVEITDIAFTSPTGARVTYDLLVDGALVLAGSKGTAVLEDGVWKVSAETLCGLAELSGRPTPEPC